jgi:hypothetical protein
MGGVDELPAVLGRLPGGELSPASPAPTIAMRGRARAAPRSIAAATAVGPSNCRRAHSRRTGT